MPVSVRFCARVVGCITTRWPSAGISTGSVANVGNYSTTTSVQGRMGRASVGRSQSRVYVSDLLRVWLCQWQGHRVSDICMFRVRPCSRQGCERGPEHIGAGEFRAGSATVGLLTVLSETILCTKVYNSLSSLCVTCLVQDCGYPIWSAPAPRYSESGFAPDRQRS